jgi:hypothetical protein
MTRRELRRFVTEFRAGILNGRPSDRMCFAVCAPLQSVLAICGVETDLVEADFDMWRPTNHVWLQCADGMIIDPTADQFSSPSRRFPKVYIGPLPAQYRAWMGASSAVDVDREARA